MVRSEALEPRRVRGERAGMALPIHPHMLRHGCGFKLANDGVDTHALQQVSVATGHPFDTDVAPHCFLDLRFRRVS
jgi:integrase